MSAFLKAEAERLQRHLDAQREEEIEREYQAMLACRKRGNRREARYHADKLRELIRLRSGAQVRRMERQRGLSRPIATGNR